MAQAPEFQPHNDREIALARDVFAGAAKGREQRLGMVFAGNKAAAVYPAKVDPDGMYRIRLFMSRPAGAEGDPDFLALLNPSTEEVLYVPWPVMVGWIKALATNPDCCHGAARLYSELGFPFLAVNAAWLRTLAVKSDTLKGYIAKRNAAMLVPEAFVHLHCHSMYSFLDGVSSPQALAEKAKANGQPGLALTDHGFGFGLLKFYQAARDVGIKPLLGIEFYIVHSLGGYRDDNGPRRHEFHQTVIAMNNTGWTNLNILASKACKDGWYYAPRITYDDLIQHNEGLILLTGCFKGIFSWHCQQFEPYEGSPILCPDGQPLHRHDPMASRQWLRQMKGVFGDRLYGEVMNVDFKRYMQAVPLMLEILNEEGVPQVVTNDCHYEVAEDAALQAVLSRISRGAVADEGDRYADRGVYYVRCRHEIEGGMYTADMFDRTCEIMERCSLHIPLPGDEDFKFLFPAYPVEQDRDWSAFKESRQAVAA